MSNSPVQSKIVDFIIYGGMICLLLSSACLYVSVSIHGIEVEPDGSEVYYVLWLTVARVFGIAAFFAGGVALVNQRWVSGVLLFAGSVFLPLVSLMFHNSI